MSKRLRRFGGRRESWSRRGSARIDGEAGRCPILAMPLVIHVHDQADLARRRRAAVERIDVDDRTEGADAGRAALSDPRPRAVGAAKASDVGALAVGTADPDRILERAQRI